MLTKKVKKTVAIAIATILVLGSAVAALSAMGEPVSEVVDKIASVFSEKKDNGIDIQSLKQPKKEKKKETDISNVTLDSSLETRIMQRDSTNGNKKIEKIKKEVAELGIEGKLYQKLEELIIKGYSISDVLKATRFLYDNYGNINEIEALLLKRNGNMSWEEIFKEYMESNLEFTPTDFPDGVIDGYIKKGFTTDDLMIADRLSKKVNLEISKLLEMKAKGKSWKEIKGDFDIVNNEERIKSVRINESDVKAYMEKYNLSDNEVVEAMITADKLDTDEEEAVKQKKDGKKKEEILGKLYEQKFD